MFSFLKKKQKNFLGIDIGTHSIKAVQLSLSKNKIVLQNYAEGITGTRKNQREEIVKRKSFNLSREEIAESLNSVIREGKISAREAVLSIPDFMSFFTVFKTPPILKEELKSVVQFESRQHIPMPPQEVSLDWSIIKEEKKDGKKISYSVLLVAVPNNAILEYQKISELCAISISSLEAEVFSLARAAIRTEDFDKTIQLVDIGEQSTTISVVKNGVTMVAYSIDFSSNNMTRYIANNLKVEYDEANEIKKKFGIDDSAIGNTLGSYFNTLVDELSRVSDNLLRTEKEKVEKIIISGGTSLISGLVPFLKEKTDKEVEIINPFSDIIYPPILEETIREMSPRFAVAVGLALRNIQIKK